MSVINLITPAEFEDRMHRIAESSEMAAKTKHRNAESLMCDVLECLGYRAGLELFRGIHKAYLMEEYEDDKR